MLELDFRVNEVRLFWPMMLASIPICVLLFFTSHSNKAPRYSPVINLSLLSLDFVLYSFLYVDVVALVSLQHPD